VEGRHDVVKVEDGHLRVPFDGRREGYKRGWLQPCLFSEGLVDRVVEGVRGLLALGLDGLFIDNVVDHDRCFGPACAGNGLDPRGVQLARSTRPSSTRTPADWW
jgi:hypothetical protein